MKKIIISFFFFFTHQGVTAQSKIDSTIIAVLSARIDHENYKVIGRQNQGITIFNSKDHVVLKLTSKDLFDEGIDKIKFIDFNKDGYLDIIISYFTNVPGIGDLIMYDKKRGKLIKIKDFSNYPAPVKIAGKSLYYSYHRSGCADNDWGSDLFMIVNFKTVKLGTIYGVGCGGDSNEKEEEGVFIYKQAKDKKRLLKKYPITVIDNYKSYKFGFIADYWNRHYKLFVR